MMKLLAFAFLFFTAQLAPAADLSTVSVRSSGMSTNMEAGILLPAPVARLTPPLIINSHLSADGKFRFVFDSTQAPELTAWSEKELMPVILEWYPKLVALLPSDGYCAPELIELEFRNDIRLPAHTGGYKISLNAPWIASELQGEAKGCVVHELCHVVQNYRQVLRTNPQATLSPSWVTEGLADYIRWFLYEPQSKGAVIQDASQAKHDASYRITANFFDWVVTTQDRDLPQQLNTAAREGRYSDALWKSWTGKTVSELAAKWKQSIEVRQARRPGRGSDQCPRNKLKE